MGRSLWLKVSALLLTLTLGACSATPKVPEATRYLPGPPPPTELPKEIKEQKGWIWGPDRKRIVLPADHVKRILQDRYRWILYGRALIKSGAWKKKPKFKSPTGMGLQPGGKAKIIVPPQPRPVGPF